MFYFHLKPYINPRNANYAHAAISIAEGFTKIGIPFSANINYWTVNNNDYLFTQNNNIKDFDIHIYTFPSIDLLNEIDTSKFNILLDLEDGIESSSTNPQFLKFNLILRSHYNKHIKYNKNVMPWAFGLTNRIIESIDLTKDCEINFQLYNSLRYPHNLRKKIVDNLSGPISKKYPVINQITDSLELEDIEGDDLDTYNWRRTGRRHNPDFYKLLNSSLLTYAVGGYEEYLPFRKNKYQLLVSKVIDRICKTIHVENSFLMYLVQYDSWRWWESLYSNAVPIHMDFESWNWELPVNPINYKHFIGVRNYKFKECNMFINSISEKELIEIGLAGKKWAFENYSPLPVAERLLSILNIKK